MKVIHSIFFLLVFLVTFSCQKDFIERDISHATIIINSPANSTVTTSNIITFWWEQVDGAEKYNLQVVKPSFTAIQKLMLDTNTTSNKFSVSLEPGNYQWRIRAVNGGGFSPYQTFDFRVDSASNLSSLTVNPVSPANGFLTGSSAVSFSWNPLNTVTYYLFEINNGSVLSATTTNTSYSYNLPAVIGANTSFTWRVRAFNDYSFSQYSAANTLTVDLANPAAPVLISPLHGATVKDTIKLAWNRAGAPDATNDSIFVSSDSLFVNILGKTRTYQQSIRINQVPGLPLINNTVYWWKAKSIDSVGNRSVFSNQLKFKLSTP